MSAANLIGQTIRTLRNQKQWTQQELAERAGMTYQYLSQIENGRENPTLELLEALAGALDISLPSLFTLAFDGEVTADPIPTVNRDFLRRGVPLPDGLTADQVADAMDESHRIVRLLNAALVEGGGRPLPAYIQANNFSGIVSNILCDAFHRLTPYKHNAHNAYPDLLYTNPTSQKQTGLEVKTTIRPGKGGESHNGHSGWHLVACFKLNAETGDICFIHAMFAVLNGHQSADPDWTYVKSTENAITGSRRTETYTTNLHGTTKLRDGSVFLNPNEIAYSRWRHARLGEMPPSSIFHTGDAL